MKRRSKRYKIKIIRAYLVVAVMITAVAMFFVDMHIRPLIKSVAQESARSVANKLINNAVANLLEDEEISYKNIIDITYDHNNNVKAVESNAIKLNRFKADVCSAISQAISNYDRGTVSVRLGSLLGSEHLLGRGPKINFKFDITSSSASRFSDSFISAGINQTKHQIMLCIDTKINILIPWYNTSTSIKTEVMIAETVIVGDVPQSFATIELDKSIN